MQRAIRVATLAILIVLGCSGMLRADQKIPSPKRLDGPPPPIAFRPLADVAEVEPNGTPAEAQSVGCDNALRPARLLNTEAGPDEDWVSFTASARDLITIATASDTVDLLPGTDTILHLFAADGATVLALGDDSPGSVYSTIAGFEAPYTGLYYVRVRGFDGAEGRYRLDVSCVPAAEPPVNDRCEGALPIASSVVPIALSGSTRHANDDFDLCPGQTTCDGCTGFRTPGRDVVYRLDVESAGHLIDVTYQLEPATADASLYIVTSCGDVRAACVGGQDTDVLNDPEHLRFAFTDPGTYYLILDAYEPGGADFTLTGCYPCATPALPLTWRRLKSIYR